MHILILLGPAKHPITVDQQKGSQNHNHFLSYLFTRGFNGMESSTFLTHAHPPFPPVPPRSPPALQPSKDRRSRWDNALVVGGFVSSRSDAVQKGISYKGNHIG